MPRHEAQEVPGDAVLTVRDGIARLPQLRVLTAKLADPVTATDTTKPRNDLTGRMFGSYRAVKRIGEGGMGQVWLAQADRLGGKLAAVKVLARDSDEDPDLLQRFWQEVYAIGMTQDDNVVQVFEAGELEDGRQYMVMEYCGGGSLAAYIARRTRPMELDLVFSITAQSASALAAAHKIGIIHRDFKPANIMLIHRPDGFIRAKLADFGIAKLLTARLDMAIRTGSKKIIGSLGYLAPEQVRSPRDLDHRVDIYALGTVLYECLTGRRPYLAETLHERLVQLAGNEPFPRPKALRADIPDALDQVVMGCLEHDRDKRIQSVEEAIARLSDTVSMGHGLTVYAAARFSSPPPSPAADDTISPGIGPAVQKLVSATGAIPRRRHALGLAATLVLGVVVGSIAVGLAWWSNATPPSDGATALAQATSTVTAGQSTSASQEATSTVRTSSASQEVSSPGQEATATDPARPKPARSDAAPMAPAGGSDSPPKAQGGAKPPDAAKPRDAAKPQDAARPLATRIPPTMKKTQDTQAKAAQTQDGVIAVSVKQTWAQVWIDGEYQEATPVRATVAAGTHKVLLVADGHREMVTVTVPAGGVSTVTRDW